MKILVVVDVQNDFVSGVFGTDMAKAAVPNIVNRIKQAEDEGEVIIFTQDTHGEDYMSTPEGRQIPLAHCIRDTWGWEFIDEIKDFMPDAIVEKGSFGDYDLINEILGCDRVYNDSSDIEQIEFIGLCTDICVIANTIGVKNVTDASTIINTELPLVVSVDASCCAGTTKEAHEAALLVMKSLGVVVKNEG